MCVCVCVCVYELVYICTLNMCTYMYVTYVNI